jgi:hypothetical protein
VAPTPRASEASAAAPKALADRDRTVLAPVVTAWFSDLVVPVGEILPLANDMEILALVRDKQSTNS